MLSNACIHGRGSPRSQGAFGSSDVVSLVCLHSMAAQLAP